MINIQHIRFGALSATLLLSTIMLSTSENNQNLIFAQKFSENITFAIPLDEYNIDQSSQSSSQPNNVNNNDDDTPTGLSGFSADNFGIGTFEEEYETTVFEDQGDTATTEDQGDTATTEDQGDTATTEDQGDTAANPLLEQIRNKINEALSDTGISGPGQ